MKRCERRVVEVVAGLVEAAGLRWRTEHGGKHLHIVVIAPDGGEHHMPVAGSPVNEDNAVNNKRQQATALLERLGVAPGRGARRHSRKARRHGSKPPRATVLVYDRPDLTKGPYRDPWAALRKPT